MEVLSPSVSDLLGRYEKLNQPPRPDLYHTSDEYYSASTTTSSVSYSKTCWPGPKVRQVWHRVWLSCFGQSKVCAACGSPRLVNTADILRADISMQTTDLSSIRQATTAHRRSMPTCLSIGTTCCRYSSLQNLSSLHVQYVYHILWHLEWQSAATYFVYHV